MNISKNNLLNKNIKFDFMLDDAPYTLESMIQFIKLYSQIMTDDGILIIEDIKLTRMDNKEQEMNFFLSRNIIYEFLDVGNCKTATIIKK